MVKHRLDRLLPLMGKVHTLYPHNTALTGTFKHIHLKALLLQIEEGKQKLLKIAVVAAVEKYRALAFAKGFDVHDRELHVFERHLCQLYPCIFALKIICVVFVEKLCCKLVIFPLVGVAVVHKKLAHAVVCYGISGALLTHGGAA